MSFEKAIEAIDAAHAEDPRITEEGPYELVYAKKCSAYLEKLAPDASEELRLAVRAQHFRRWEVPRDSYPMGKSGYYKWRTGLKARQAQQTADLCAQFGYTKSQTDRIASMIRKEDFKGDAETQILEDVACLVFLDDGFEQFSREHEEDKIIHILRKTWPKMSDKGHDIALGISMSSECSQVIQKALS